MENMIVYFLCSQMVPPSALVLASYTGWAIRWLLEFAVDFLKNLSPDRIALDLVMLIVKET